MKVLTTRVDEHDDNDLKLIEKTEKADRSVVVRKMLSDSIKNWKKKFAIEKLKKREVSIKKAAEIAGITFSDMLDLMAEENIDIGYSLQNLEEDFAKLKKK